MSKWREAALAPPAIISLIVSIGATAVVNFWIDGFQRARGARIEQILKFSTSGDDLIVAANDYVSNVANGSNSRSALLDLQRQIQKQVLISENVKIIFTDHAVQQSIDDYEDKLNHLKSASERVQDASDMRPWLESLGSALDARRQVTKILLEQGKITS